MGGWQRAVAAVLITPVSPAGRCTTRWRSTGTGAWGESGGTGGGRGRASPWLTPVSFPLCPAAGEPSSGAAWSG